MSGKHLIVAPIDAIADAVQYYLTHEAERRQIVDAAQRLATEELSVAQMCGRILARARTLRTARMA